MLTMWKHSERLRFLQFFPYSQFYSSKCHGVVGQSRTKESKSCCSIGMGSGYSKDERGEKRSCS